MKINLKIASALLALSTIFSSTTFAVVTVPYYWTWWEYTYYWDPSHIVVKGHAWNGRNCVLGNNGHDSGGSSPYWTRVGHKCSLSNNGT